MTGQGGRTTRPGYDLLVIGAGPAGAAAAWTLGPEAQLLHLCAHLLQHGGLERASLIWLHDLAEVIALAERFADLTLVLQAAAAPGELALTVPDAAAALAPIMARANETGLHIRTVTIEEPNLEAVFLHLTGKALRD